MTDQEWKLAVGELIRQGVVKDEVEAMARLLSGEKLKLTMKVDTSNWHGYYGTIETIK